MDAVIQYEVVSLAGHTFVNWWAPAFHLGRECTLAENLSIVRTLRRKLEPLISSCLKVGDRPYVEGWATWVECDHKKVADIVQRLGGKPYMLRLPNAIWYVKFIDKEA